MKIISKESLFWLQNYDCVEDKENQDGVGQERQADTFLGERPGLQYSQTKNPTAKIPWAWMASTTFFILTTIIALSTRSECKGGEYETGFATDLEPAQSVARIKQTRFTSGLAVLKNHTVIQASGSGPYTGPPSDEIDDVWGDLLLGLDILLDGDEARTVEGRTQEVETGRWRVGLDAYHTLHCLNIIRVGLDLDYYYPAGNVSTSYRAHVDHCIDHIRQYVQCNADMSPVFFYWDENVPGWMPNFAETLHTCRDWDKLDSWAKKRSKRRQGL